MKHFHACHSDPEVVKAHEEELVALSKKPDIVELLARSLGADIPDVVHQLSSFNIHSSTSNIRLSSSSTIHSSSSSNIHSYASAPNIFEFENVKRGVMCQLFGGANKHFRESGRGRFRFECIFIPINKEKALS